MEVTLSALLTEHLEAHGLQLWQSWSKHNLTGWASDRSGRWMCFVHPDWIEVRTEVEHPDPVVIIKATDPDFLTKVCEAVDKIVAKEADYES